ncbi:MAG: DUF2207 domain-containing protein [Thermodesulfovibrionales bacterium]|nr:DUF2207 domain-containing protein [Thermodesulfovibrionales bacterium]
MQSINYKKQIIFCVFAFVLCLFISSAYSGEDFYVTKFHSDINIHLNARITIVETLEVFFHRPRRGIIREIPYIYTDDIGRRVKTPIKVVGVKDEFGNPSQFKISEQRGFLSIKIGNPTIYISGKKTYIITYTLENVVQFFPDRDELYWNVTGNGWNTSIKNVSAKVTLPLNNVLEDWIYCYTGPSGSKESKCSYKKLSKENSIEFISRDLAPLEGFTIAYGWNKGIVKAPGYHEKLLSTIGNNIVFILPIVSLVFMTTWWYFKGRDPKPLDSVLVQYFPPSYKGNPLTPAEVGTLIDESLNPRDITAAIIGLAVKGFIKIKEREEIDLESLDEISKKILSFFRNLNLLSHIDYLIIKAKELDDSLTGFERELMNSLFNSKDSVYLSELTNNFYKYIPALQRAIFNDLILKNYFESSPQKVKKKFILLGIIISIVCPISVIYLIDFPQLSDVLAGILTGVPFIIFARFMPIKTFSGAKALYEIRGFEEFLNRAERDRLEKMNDERLFEKYLPYAIALNLVDRWAKAFEGIYQKPAEWYTAKDLGFYSPTQFVSRLNDTISKMNNTLTSAPRSSGGRASSGRGFSGGGFGGGGGRSW